MRFKYRRIVDDCAGGNFGESAITVVAVKQVLGAVGNKQVQMAVIIVIPPHSASGVAAATSVRPDLVLMDMSLPVIDGWEATRQLKADPLTCSIPILGLTAHAMVSDRARVLEAGCDDYDTKPVDMTRLLTKIESLLARPARTGG